MRAVTRPVEVELVPVMYPSSVRPVAAWCGGIADSVNGVVYLPGPGGSVQTAEVHQWIAKELLSGQFHVLTESEVFEQYLPHDVLEAYNTLGGRAWPSTQREVDDLRLADRRNQEDQARATAPKETV